MEKGQIMKFVDVNSPEFVEAMVEVQTRMFEKMKEEKGFISTEAYMNTKDAAKFLGIDTSDWEACKQKMTKLKDPNRFDPPLYFSDGVAGHRFKVADLIEFMDARRKRKYKAR